MKFVKFLLTAVAFFFIGFYVRDWKSREAETVEKKLDVDEGAGVKQVDKVVAPKVVKKVVLPKFPTEGFVPGGYDYSKAVHGTISGLVNSRVPSTGVLVDLNSRKVLWCKNPQKSVPIASMTKMMTMLLACESIAAPANGVDLTTKIKVTKEAFRIGGSQVYLDPSETFTINELLKSIAIKSANDSAYLVGQYLGSGDVMNFVTRMNRRSKEMGLTSTRFYNPHGLPKRGVPDNASTPESLVKLSEALLRYPLAMKYAGMWSDNFRPKGSKGWQLMTNHNRLVKQCPGVDGMKTGFTNNAGFCTTVTCRRGGRRLVAVVTGFKVRKSRDAFVKQLLDWGYAQAAGL